MQKNGLFFLRRRTHPYRSRGILFVVPLSLCILLVFHPILDRTDTLHQLAPIATVWISIHVALVPLFGLMSWCFFLLLAGVQNWPARISRIFAVVWSVLSIAYESAIGLVSGVFSLNEQSHGIDQQIVQQSLTRYLYAALFDRAAIVIIFSGLFAVIFAVIALYRAGAPRLLSLFLLGSIFFAVGHESPFGPLGNGFFFWGALLIECFWQTSSEHPIQKGHLHNSERADTHETALSSSL